MEPQEVRSIALGEPAAYNPITGEELQSSGQMDSGQMDSTMREGRRSKATTGCC